MPRRLHYHSRPVFVFQPNFNVEDVFSTSTINSDQFRMSETYQSFDAKVKMDKDSKDSIFQHLQLALDLVTRWKKNTSISLSPPESRAKSCVLNDSSKKQARNHWNLVHLSTPQYTTTCHSSPTPFLLVTQMKRLQDSSKLDSESPKMWHLVRLNFGLQIQPARFLSTLCVQATRRAWQLKYSVASTICSSHASLSVTMMAVLHSPRHPESHDHGKWWYYSLPRRNGQRSCDTGARAHCDTGKKAFHTTRKIHPPSLLFAPVPYRMITSL